MKRRLNKTAKVTETFETSVSNGKPGKELYVLRLYITGMTPRSAEALSSIKAICEKHLHGSYYLEVIDLYQHPALASDEQIIASPTLVKKQPAPLRRLVGNLSYEDRVLTALDLNRDTQGL
jgi:circadian clock protein KaiB